MNRLTVQRDGQKTLVLASQGARIAELERELKESDFAYKQEIDNIRREQKADLRR